MSPGHFQCGQGNLGSWQIPPWWRHSRQCPLTLLLLCSPTPADLCSNMEGHSLPAKCSPPPAISWDLKDGSPGITFFCNSKQATTMADFPRPLQGVCAAPTDPVFLDLSGVVASPFSREGGGGWGLLSWCFLIRTREGGGPCQSKAQPRQP